jgi:septum formation protein
VSDHRASGEPAVRLVLASASPRREALLRQIGLEFEVLPAPDVESDLEEPADPAEAALAAADAKARAVAAEQPGRLVLGADTVVCLGSRRLGKPESDAEAAEMLRALSGREHVVRTGVVLEEQRNGQVEVLGRECVATAVRFAPLTAERIRWYVSTGEPADKAGAYGIQGRGAVLVEAIRGDYCNVVGLPLGAVCRLLEQAGLELPGGSPEGDA